MVRGKIQLTLKDRLFLVNQYRILEILYPEESDSYKQYREIVENGYELHYSDLTTAIAEEGLSEDICRQVMDMLEMHRALKYSYEALEDKANIDALDLVFCGFDGNNESVLLGYVRYLILIEERWEEVLEGRPGFDLNSHMKMFDIYNRMLDEWIRIGKKFELSSTEIRGILDARIHSSHRS